MDFWPLISIITPLINERDCVKPFFEQLRSLNGDFELILVDGGSSDGTLEEAKKNIEEFSHATKLLEARFGRAAQMNRGAEEAEGDVLLFLHVDCLVPKDSLKLIETEISENGIIGGALRQTFSNSDFFLRFMSIFGNLRSQLTGTFFGDYGIFLRKEVFQKIGGYDNTPFLEDVELCRKAKRYGRLVQIDSYIFTSPRRYLSNGRLRTTIIFTVVCLLNFLRLRPRFFIKHMTYK